MNVSFVCPHCTVEVEAEDSILGTSQPCPRCDKAVRVPRAHVGPGVEIGGFRLKKLLNQGGSGKIFYAEQLATGRAVAVKVLLPELTVNQAVVRRFLNEVRMTAKLEHPNLVKILSAGEESGFYYYAMPYVEGVTFKSLLRRRGPFPEREALVCIRQVVEALAFAWDQHQMLHRDLKPSNLMIDKHGKVRILDMGLAKSMLEDVSLTIDGTVVGTPYYMSPEQAGNGGAVDFRADQYSVGATLYHMLAGNPPYIGTGVAEILAQHALKPLPSLRGENPAVSEECARMVERMLAKTPDDRYPGYQALLADIAGCLQGGTGENPAATSRRRKKKSSISVKRRRRPSVQLARHGRKGWGAATVLGVVIFIIIGLAAAGFIALATMAKEPQAGVRPAAVSRPDHSKEPPRPVRQQVGRSEP